MDFLFKAFIKDYEDVKNPKVRDAYGKLAGIVGIVSNVVLCVIKYLIGSISGSIAIMADAVNNLADAASSVITLVGFKLAAMPENEDHPYGHARIEYIAGMIVSMIILMVGFTLGKESVMKIIHPEPIEFSWVVVIVLVIAIGIKLLQAIFNVSAGKKINSLALIATGADSRNDVISTTAVLVSLIIAGVWNINIDGYMGVAVALFVIYAGFSLTMETISPILGEAPDPELVQEIEDICLSHPEVLGIHDLVVHQYGPGKTFASVHIEVDSRIDIMESHDLIDRIEYELRGGLNIFATGHMDPIDVTNPDREPIAELIEEEIRELDGVYSFHDLRFVPGPTHTNVIFDLLISPECKIPQNEISQKLLEKIRTYNPNFFCVINYDKNYTGKREEKED